MKYNGKYVRIIDHPVGRIVYDVWTHELNKRGIDHVYKLTDAEYQEVATMIDRMTERFFVGQYGEELDNLRNAWNYQARHKRQSLGDGGKGE